MANMTRWDPFSEMLSLREAMNQLFEDSVVAPSTGRRGQNGFTPALDLSETEEGYLVEAAVPGMKPEDLQITVENNVLTIKGELRQETEDKKRNYHRIERRFGAFSRQVALPVPVDFERADASFKDGVLEICIPKKEEAKAKSLKIK